MALTTFQKDEILGFYQKTGVPSDRLPHSPELNLIAETVKVPASVAWRFLYNCRRPNSDKKLSMTVGVGGQARSPLPKLEERNTALFESEIPHLINSAENSVYYNDFLNFATRHPQRTAHQWAVDLIRYRKQKNEKRRRDAVKAKGIVAQGGVASTAGAGLTSLTISTSGVSAPTPAIAVPALVFAILNLKDNTYFVGPSSEMVAGLTILGGFDEETYADVRQSIRSDELARNSYRLFKDDVLFVLDNFGDDVRATAYRSLGY